jgi:hypothetical protein
MKCVLLSGSGVAKALSAPCLCLAVIRKHAIAACSACVPVCSRRTNRAERKARIAFVAIGLIHGPADCLISLQPSRGPILKHTMLSEPHRCEPFGEHLFEIHRQWLENFPPH